jgi:hypothetical protein
VAGAAEVTLVECRWHTEVKSDEHHHILSLFYGEGEARPEAPNGTRRTPVMYVEGLRGRAPSGDKRMVISQVEELPALASKPTPCHIDLTQCANPDGETNQTMGHRETIVKFLKRNPEAPRHPGYRFKSTKSAGKPPSPKCCSHCAAGNLWPSELRLSGPSASRGGNLVRRG